MDAISLGVLFLIGFIYLSIGVIISLVTFKLFVPENSERSLKIITLAFSFFMGAFYMSYITEPIFIGCGDHPSQIHTIRLFIFINIVILFIIYLLFRYMDYKKRKSLFKKFR